MTLKYIGLTNACDDDGDNRDDDDNNCDGDGDDDGDNNDVQMVTVVM